MKTDRIKKWSALFLAAATALSPAAETASPFLMHSYASESGHVTASNLNVRSGPGTGNSRVGQLANGAQVTIEETVTGSDGKNWYHISAGGIDGYVLAQYITKGTASTGSNASLGDASFESSISGFPESYKSLLRSLHASHPSWTFKPYNTGLDWNEAVAAESTVGKNLVESSGISSWKSTEEGAYDWSTGKWTGFDGSTWVAASEGVIAYYMDPRNFLTDRYIYQFMDQNYDGSVETKEGLTEMVQGTFLAGQVTTGSSVTPGSGSSSGSSSDSAPQGPGLETTASSTESSSQTAPGTAAVSAAGPGSSESSSSSASPSSQTTESYVDILMDAASESGVNPYTLAASILEEQGQNGTGNSISGTVSGYRGIYNFFNIEAYASGSMTAVQRGLWWASQSGSYNRPWNSARRSIVGGADWYGTNYVKAGQSTIYLKKFNVTENKRYRHEYMTNVQGAAEEGLALANISALAREQLVFSIPVFNNMPDTPCVRPSGDGSPNNKLQSLGVSGFSITPSFSRDTESYNLIVDTSVNELTVNASAIDSNASVSGTGTVSLADTQTDVTVTVKAQNGSTRTYTIHVIRQSNGPTAGTKTSVSEGTGTGPGHVTAKSTGSSGRSTSGTGTGSTSSGSSETKVTIINPATTAGSTANYHAWSVKGPAESSSGN